MAKKILGEFGPTCGYRGNRCVVVRLVHGHSREIRRIWRELDSADGPGQYRLLTRLASLGALVTE